MKTVLVKNESNLIVGDECFVEVNGNVYGKSKVLEVTQLGDLIAVSLPADAIEYIEICEQNNRPMVFSLFQ